MAVDGVIVGAGAAGIAAARDLHEQGVSLVVLEARERIGGRIWTHRGPGTPIPIELGAEFIHGSAPEIEQALSDAKLRTVDIAGRRWMVSGARWAPLDDFWDRLYRVMHLMKGKGGRGQGTGDRGKEEGISGKANQASERPQRPGISGYASGGQAARARPSAGAPVR